jgi:hypothetical protein
MKYQTLVNNEAITDSTGAIDSIPGDNCTFRGTPTQFRLDARLSFGGTKLQVEPNGLHYMIPKGEEDERIAI